jgi:hypothetical protein
MRCQPYPERCVFCGLWLSPGWCVTSPTWGWCTDCRLWWESLKGTRQVWVTWSGMLLQADELTKNTTMPPPSL